VCLGHPIWLVKVALEQVSSTTAHMPDELLLDAFSSLHAIQMSAADRSNPHSQLLALSPGILRVFRGYAFVEKKEFYP
jgi:hypothetical protein